MKKIILIVSWLFLVNNLFSQQTFCEDFNQYNATTTALLPNCNYQLGILNNWGESNMNWLKYTDVGSINGVGDYFLQVDDGGCGSGSSYVHNDVDYQGNWINMVPQEEGCFCFDIKLFSQIAGTYNGNSLMLMNGSSPTTSTVRFTFVLNNPIDTSSGWIRVCAPIALANADGTPPSNANGQWVVNTGSNSDWNSLITNVKAIGFSVDIGGGNEVFGYDNICITDGCVNINEPEPTDEGAFCCDVELDATGNPINPNLVQNGNFEFGNVNFSSAYTQTSSTFPGEYNVTNSASAFGASVTDHSYCEDAVQFANNDMFLIVNGKTQQSGSSVIWEQNITGLRKGKEYKLCANFKDMEQCTFNIFPKITMSAGSFSVTQVINTDDTNPCDWERLEICFTAEDSSINIKIELDETGNGDGNDLAIDDIALQEKLDPNYFITVQHQGNNNTITGSLNTIANTDDILYNDICFNDKDDKYYWFVYETTMPQINQLPLFPTGMVSGTFGWSSNVNAGGTANPLNTIWNLTTTFPNYSPTFDSNKFYVIGMYIPSCCESCYTEKWLYQITYNNRSIAFSDDESAFTEDMKKYLKSKFISNQVRKSDTTKNTINAISNVSVYPNPSSDMINVSLKNENISSIEVYSLSGQKIFSINMDKKTNHKNINISKLSKGLYMVNVISDNSEGYSTKFIKK